MNNDKNNRILNILLEMRPYCIKITNILFKLGNSYENYLKDEDLFDSISMKLLQIGELAKKLKDDNENFIKETNDEAKWYKIIGMRNNLTHNYTGINKYIVFETITKHIPLFLIFLDKEINNYLKTNDIIKDYFKPIKMLYESIYGREYFNYKNINIIENDIKNGNLIICDELSKNDDEKNIYLLDNNYNEIANINTSNYKIIKKGSFNRYDLGNNPNILNFLVDENLNYTIKTFLEFNNVGNELFVKHNKNVDNITLKELNTFLKKTNFKTIQFYRNNEIISNDKTLSKIQNINNKEYENNEIKEKNKKIIREELSILITKVSDIILDKLHDFRTKDKDKLKAKIEKETNESSKIYCKNKSGEADIFLNYFCPDGKYTEAYLKGVENKQDVFEFYVNDYLKTYINIDSLLNLHKLKTSQSEEEWGEEP